jgi:uncharacterized protein YecE (DUF72 family)
MAVFAGTSGYSYKQWKGVFYPEGVKPDAMLAYYATRLPAVEINNTFYRMPKTAVVERWRDETPEPFRFVLKASRRITHIARLRDCADAVAYLFSVADHLGPKLGPVLFQLPPFLKKDVALLVDFIASLPAGRRAAFEFRNASWFSDDVYSALRDGSAALVGGDVDDDGKTPPLVHTADFAYLRLRRSDYSLSELVKWRDRIAAEAWHDVYAFFKHEQRGPELASWLNENAR